MKSHFSLTFVVAVLLLATTGAIAQKPESKPAPSPSPSPTPLRMERETPFDGDVKFPEVDGWDLSGKYRYPTAALGYSVNYESKTSRVTVYVYTGGRKSIPSDLGGLVTDEMKKAKSELQAAVDAGMYDSANAGKTETINIGRTKGVVKTLYTPVSIKARGNELYSEIYIFPYNNYFIKIRATHRTAESAKGSEFSGLLEAIDLLFSN